MPFTQLSPSRRKFLALSGMGVAGFTQESAFLESNLVETGLRPQSLFGLDLNNSVPGAKIDANENPYGPSEKAIAAMQASFSKSGRYVANPAKLHMALSNHHQVSPGMIEIGYGSSEILKMAVEAFIGSGKNVVLAQPTYEAVPRYGEVYGASAVRVPLDESFHHDLKKMRAAVTDKTGLVYICNPNNPTATVVPAETLKIFVESMPPDVPVLIDEAYYHYVDDSSYASAIPLAQRGKAVIVTRTFSKIYGMAGLRMGYCVGREDLVRKMSPYKIWLNCNVLTLAAALASLDDNEHVERNRKLNAETRKYVEEQITRMGLGFIPSQANFLMIHLEREVSSVLGALRQEGVYAGRPFYPLNNHLRVTIGTAAEMKRFVEVLKGVMA